MKAKNKRLIVTPPVYLVLPVYNSAKFLTAALTSLAQQTYPHWQLYALDDGSHDQSWELLQDFANQRPSNQVHLIRQQKNQGLVKSLNRLLKALPTSNNAFVARFDADDLMTVDRLEKQVAFLLTHPKVDLLGSAYRLIDQYDQPGSIVRHYRSPLFLQKALLFYNPLAHPTLMWRQDWQNRVQLQYQADFPHCEDYATWLTLAPQTTFANLSRPLLYYRQHSDQVSTKNLRLQTKYTQFLSKQAQKNFLASLSDPTLQNLAQNIIDSPLPKTIKIFLLTCFFN